MLEKQLISDMYNQLFADYPDVVNVSDLCHMLGIGKIKAYELVHSGVIKTIPCGRNFKIPKVFIINFVLNGSQPQDNDNGIKDELSA